MRVVLQSSFHNLWMSSALAALVATALPAAAGDGIWSGPLIAGGAVNALAAHPDDGSVVYAMTSGGLFVSRDAGSSWVLTDGGFGRAATTVAVGRFLFQRQSASNALLLDSRLGRLWRTADAGATWRLLENAPSPGAVSSPSLQIAGSEDLQRLYLSDSRSRLHRSIDGGESWQAVTVPWPPNDDLTTEEAGNLNALAASPSAGDVLVASVNLLRRDTFTTRAVVYRSEDGGETWSEVAGLPWGDSQRISRMGFDPYGSGRLAAMVVALSGQQVADLWVSDDGGLSFSENLTASESQSVIGFRFDPVLGGQPWIVTQNGIRRPTGPDTSELIQRPASTPGARAPNAIISDLAIAADTLAAGQLLIASAAGVYASSDLGQSLVQSSSGIAAQSGYRYLVDPGLDTRRYLALYTDNAPFPALLRSDDAGGSFGSAGASAPDSLGANTAEISILPWVGPGGPQAGQLLLPTFGAFMNQTRPALKRSEDGGASWVDQNVLTPELNGRSVVGLSPIPGSEPPTGGYAQRLIAGYAPVGVYVSEDGGTSWTPSSTGLPALDEGVVGTPAQPYRLVIRLLQVSPADPDHIWLSLEAFAQSGSTSPAAPGSVPTGVFVSTDGGSTWTQRVSGLPNATPSLPGSHFSPTSLALDPFNPDRAFAAILVNLVQGPRTYRTEDGGLTWTEDLTLRGSAERLFDPNTQGVVYAVASGRGLVRSTDGGNTWAPYNRGIEDLVSGRSLTFDPARNGLAVTTGSGNYVFNIVPDADDDGVPDAVEANGPGGGDANDDGVPDSGQANVATDTIPGLAAQDALSLSKTPGDVGFTISIAPLDGGSGCDRLAAPRGFLADSTRLNTEVGFPAPYVFPDGLVSVQIPACSAAEVQLKFHGRTFTADNVLRSYGAPENSTVPAEWRALQGGATLSPDGSTWTFQVIDGSPQDIASIEESIWVQVAVGTGTGLFRGSFEDEP